MFTPIIMSVFFIYSSLGSAQVEKINPSNSLKSAVKIVYVTRVEKDKFDKEISPYFKEQTQCKNCLLTFVSLPSDIDSPAIEKLKAEISSETKIVFFDFNLKMIDSLMPLKDYLKGLIQDGKLLITTAGEPVTGEPSLPLRKTLMGQVGNSIIIGEISDRDRLLPMSYFGPEIFTAIRPPKEIVGRKLAPFYFVTQFSGILERRSAESWQAFFKEKKAKNKRLWLEMGDLIY